ncbi:MAG: beta-ketoacyl synthase [Microgenomates group bacterium]
MKRVVISGAGTINALAHDVAGTYQALTVGTCGIGPLQFPDLDRLSVKIGAQVQGFDPTAHFDRNQLGLLDRYTQFALVAARQAIAHSGLPLASVRDQTGVIIGTAGGGLGTSEDSYRAVFEQSKNRVHPLTVPRLMSSSASSHVSMEFGLHGPSFSLSSACASSNHAIGLAFQMVRSGSVPAMICGGAEAMLTFGGIKAWEGLRVMSKSACRPFSANRDGMVQGEGAAIFVLEDRDLALARGAPILAEILGQSMTADAYDIVQPSAEGAARTMQRALEDAGLTAQDIGYINAHGTGTTVNDRVETAAIHAVFGDHARHLLVSSTKSMHGHAIGATGAIEALACLMALQRGTIPPTIGYELPDPACDLDYVANVARHKDIAYCLSNAFAFGGLNSVLIFGRG